MEVRCTQCGKAADPNLLCACGGVAEFETPQTRLDPAGLRRLVRDRRASYEPLFTSGVWRMRELLPPIPSASIVSLGEGNVPIYQSPSGARYAGVDRLSYLHLGMNPTGSLCDLGMTVAISAARAAGANAVMCASKGSVAVSMTAFASQAQLDSYIADVDGNVENAVVVDSNNAYYIEGAKCAALLLLEARGWRVPDWVVLPNDPFDNVRAVAKGFRDALMLGLIERMPHIAVASAEPHADVPASLAQIRSMRRDGVLHGHEDIVAILAGLDEIQKLVVAFPQCSLSRP